MTLQREVIEQGVAAKRILTERREKDALHNWRPTPKQQPFIRSIVCDNWAVVGFIAANRSGKCLPLSEPVLRADGSWSRLDEINTGDWVMAYDIGSRRAVPAQVTATHRSGKNLVWKTTFSDGGSIRSTANHVFPGWRSSGRTKHSHGEIVENAPKKRRLSEYKVREKQVSTRSSLMSPERCEFQGHDNLPLHPYLLGALLGDGLLSRRGVGICNIDPEVLDRVASVIPDGGALVPWGGASWGIVYHARNDAGHPTNPISVALKALGLYKSNSGTKFIPKQYRTASPESRKELLAGLIDTDGSPNDFVSKSERLAEGFCFLIRSLGGKATLSAVSKKCANNGAIGDYYRVYWRLEDRLPLSIARKQTPDSKRRVNYQRRVIRSIDLDGFDDVGCITIDHPDHCFIAGDWVVTGNSDAGAYAGAMLARYGDEAARFVGAKDSKIQIRDRSTSGWVVSLDFPSSRDTIQPKYFDNGFVPPSATHKPFIPDHEIEEWRVSDQVLRLKNGSIVGFKCLRWDQPVLMADGTYKKISEVRENETTAVRSHFGRAGVIEKSGRVQVAASTGRKRLLNVTLRGGREIICSPDHKFFDGLRWVEASKLKKGGTLPYYGTPEPQNPTPLEFSPWLLGFMIGDGHLAHREVSISCANPDILARVQREVSTIGIYRLRHWVGTGTYTISQPRDASVQGYEKGSLIRWLRELGLWETRSRTKFVPDAVFRAPNEQVAEFLSGLFAADGSITPKPTISLSTSSYELAVGVQRLLDRFAIKTAVWYVQSTDSWRVVTMGRGPTAQFLDRIEWCKYLDKAQALRETLPTQPVSTPHRIKSISVVDEDETFDICVEGHHCYTTQGVVVHNSCDSERKKFQGAEKNWIHFDEEPPKPIYEECVIRVGQSRLKTFFTCTLLPPEGQQGGVSWMFDDFIQPFQEGTATDIMLYGASIYDNPHLSAEAIAGLESIYPEGSTQRRIRLGGEWLPGLSGARAYTGFDRRLHMRSPGVIQPYMPLAWFWDFNVEPMVSGIGQYDAGMFKVFKEFILDEGNIPDMVEAFIMEVPNHRGEIYLYGDATGAKRSHQTKEMSTDWQVILNQMSGYGVPVRKKVKDSNPYVADRINSVNGAFKDDRGVVCVQVDPGCTELVKDFEQVLMDGPGRIKKVRNNKDPYYRRTHISDAFGYWVAREKPIRVRHGRGEQRTVIPQTPSYGQRGRNVA